MHLCSPRHNRGVGIVEIAACCVLIHPEIHSAKIIEQAKRMWWSQLAQLHWQALGCDSEHQGSSKAKLWSKTHCLGVIRAAFNRLLKHLNVNRCLSRSKAEHSMQFKAPGQSSKAKQHSKTCVWESSCRHCFGDGCSAGFPCATCSHTLIAAEVIGGRSWVIIIISKREWSG